MWQGIFWTYAKREPMFIPKTDTLTILFKQVLHQNMVEKLAKEEQLPAGPPIQRYAASNNFRMEYCDQERTTICQSLTSWLQCIGWHYYFWKKLKPAFLVPLAATLKHRMRKRDQSDVQLLFPFVMLLFGFLGHDRNRRCSKPVPFGKRFICPFASHHPN